MSGPARSWQRLLALPLLIGLILLDRPAEGAKAADLTGRWLLDAENSDDVERASRRALREIERLLQPPGGSQRSVANSARQRAEAVLAPLAPPTEQVAIAFEGVTAIFQIDGGTERRFYTDGRAAVVDSSSPEQSIAAWEDGRLYIERTFSNATRVIETWWLQGVQLRVDYEARNSLFSEPVRFTLRFNRAPP